MTDPPSSESPSDQGAAGRPLSPERQGDLLAIQGLAIAYGHAVDDRDWEIWRALFSSDAHLDYTHSGGIAGPIEEVAAWMPDAVSVFTWCMHSVFTHEVRFTGTDAATGRVHLFNRNGLEWNGKAEMVDLGGLYLDEYVRTDDRWLISRRTERTHYVTGGEFAAVVRQLIATTAPELPAPSG